jgi:exopolysaccharide production protein ExoQ
MSPAIALALCGCFVALLLKQEKRLIRTVSGASWLPSIWMLYFASRPLVRWLDPKGVIDESPVDGFFLLALMCLALIVVAKRRIDWVWFFRGNRWLLILAGYTLISSLLFDDPIKHLKQWIRLSGSLIMAIVVLSERDPRQALETILARTVYVLVPLSVVLIKYFPELGVEYRSWNGEKFWVGATLQKNGLGRLCLICGVFLFWRLLVRFKRKASPALKRRSYLEALLFFGVAWMLVGPGDNRPMTAIATLAMCMVALVCLLRTDRSLRYRIFTFLSAFTVVSGLALALISVAGILPGVGADMVGRDRTLTGRTYIWDEVRRAGWESPIFGVGYGGYWEGHRVFPVVGIVNEGHNGYLDVFVETGVVGILLILVLIAAFARDANREKTRHYDWACLRIVLLLLVVAHNFTETSLLRPTTHLWVLFTYVCTALPQARFRKVAASRRSASDDVASERSAARFIVCNDDTRR